MGGGVAVLALAEFGLTPRTEAVPPEGFDPSTIAIAWDRNSIRIPREESDGLSDALSAAGILYSTSLPLVLPQPNHPGFSRMRGVVVQIETLLLTTAVSQLLKAAFSRPRPFTYVPETERPDSEAYKVTSNRAFESFPSGHTASTWASTTTAICYLSRERPDLSWGVHFASGAIAGGLAMSTSLLRIDATQHFPTDLLGGMALGVASGGLVVHLHPVPSVDPEGSRRAWRAGIWGMGAGVVLAALLTPPVSPFID
jgi:hypothetical protein